MRTSAFQPNSALFFLVLFTLLVVVAASASGPVTGTYKVVIIQTTYSDGPAAVSTQANLNLAAGEIHDYFNKLSFGALDVEVTVGRASLTQPMSHYWSSCPAADDAGRMCVDEGALTSDAAEAAGAGGASFTNAKVTVVLSPCGVNDPYDNFTSGGDQDLNSTHAHAHVHRVFDTDCPDNPAYPLSEFPHLGPSGVNWHGWVHEIGHTLQLEGHDMFSHPGGYSSGYDLMDSCYPCGETVYSLSGNPVVSNLNDTSFPGWLPSSKTITIPRPSTGTAGGTYVLESVNKPDPGSTVAPRGIKLPLDGDRSIFVEARTAVGADARSYGLFDEGIHMYIAQESGTDDNGNPKPLTMLNACDTTVSGGCVNSDSDSRYSSCLTPAAHVSTGHPYCWPFVLWHPGDTFNDPINAIMMHVNGKVGDGYGVTVTRNVPPGHPDPFLYPWLTAPMNTYETVDIWVDSSCNGYEDTVGAAGLRYGRRSDTTVIGNGDDPCANHENRIYARVRNGGSVPANNVTVHFRASDPLGVGMTGSWSDVGSTTIPSIPANGFRDVYVTWTPHVTLTPAEISSGHFNFHSCVQVHTDPIPGELVTSNNDAQENFDHFEAVRDPISHHYTVPDRSFFLANNYTGMHANITGAAMGSPADFRKPIELRVKSQLPADWTYEVNGGTLDFVLAPHEVKQIPVKIKVPDSTPVAQTFNLRVTAFAQHHVINRAVAPTSPNYWHYGWMQENGVVEGVHTVDPSKITITAEWKCPDTTRALTHVPPAQIVVKGKLEPAHNNVIIAIDYTPPSGPVQTHLVHTNAAGEFQDTLNSPAAGEWHIRAFWQGDMDHSGAVSEEQKVSPRDCGKKQEQQPTQPTRPTPLPPGSTVLLPPDSFPGGVLTGVVIGPDDKPVPNTPVQIAGGVPTELTGVVIGEEPTPERPKPPERQPCTPDPATGQLPAGCPPPTQTACGPNTPAGTPGCPGGKQPTLPPINVPQDCASLLQKARGILDQAGGTDHILIGLDQPSVSGAAAGEFGKQGETGGGAGFSGGQDTTGNTYLNQNGGGITTDANGRFALCVRPDSKKVDVTLGDGSVRGSVPATGQPPSGACDKPPQFFQPADRIDLCQPAKRPTLEQGGQTWLLPAVQAISPNGDQVLTTVRTPRDLQPGEATLSFVDQGGQKRSFTGGVFRIVSASLDRNKLRSNEGADFDYELAFSPQWGGRQLCINVGTSGPIVLAQPPPPQLDVNGDGHASVKGKIRATQVAPGSATPFSIKLHISDCREAATQP